MGYLHYTILSKTDSFYGIIYKCLGSEHIFAIQVLQYSRLEFLRMSDIIRKFYEGFILIKGFILDIPYLIYEDTIKNFTIRDDDIWICSFPRSGTSWVQEMVWLLVNNSDYKTAKELNQDDRVPFFEREASFKRFELHTGCTLEYRKSFDYIANLKSRRIIKTHLPWPLIPKDLQSKTQKAKIIYIMRDPKDVVVSYYHFLKLLISYNGSFTEFFHLFVEDKLAYAPYWSHIFSYLNRAHQENIFILRYEEMKNDLSDVIKRVSEFLNIDIAKINVESLMNYLSFESMKENESIMKESSVEMFRKFNIANNKEKFLRSGACGQYKEVMDEEMVKIINAWISKHTKNTNFSFYINE